MTWATKILYPAPKWLPLYVPNDNWERIPSPPRPGEAPKVPDGVAAYWWKLPKSQWPYQTPWAPKPDLNSKLALALAKH